MSQAKRCVVRAVGAVAAVWLGGCGAEGTLQEGAAGPDVQATSEAELRRAVVPAKELVITDRSVVESPLETRFDPRHPSGRAPQGAWSFGRAVHNLLPAEQRGDAAAASRFVVQWLEHWEVAQAPSASVRPSAPRATMRTVVLEPWKLASGCSAGPESDDSCTLDMARAPFQLIAIVNRPDLRIVAPDDTAIGGEGRFVFQVVGPTLSQTLAGETFIADAAPSPQKFTVIFEYSLPVSHRFETLRWAQRWHQLGALPFGPAYNALLRSVTNDFSGPDADRRRPNGSALNQLRTNEVALLGNRTVSTSLPPQLWELREFRLSRETGLLQQHTVNLEPSREYDLPPRGTLERSQQLAELLLSNRDAVLANTHQIPTWMLASSTLVGTGFPAWGSGGTFTTVDGRTVDPELRRAFALNTCGGCHRHETDTRHTPARAATTGTFLHLSSPLALDLVDRPADLSTTSLSAFLRDEVAAPTTERPLGGPRYADFTRLLHLQPQDVCNATGLRVCG